MSSAVNEKSTGTMLDLWRPPSGAGDPIGCITSTFTFAPSLFDEQCLARFLEIESEPNREDLAFLLEREAKLGGVYAGVLVDQVMAGVEHSLRWDVLPVRIPGGKQHAKLSLIRWSKCIRIIVASANLTEQGYRTNSEVAAASDLTEHGLDPELIVECARFLESLISFVPGADRGLAQVTRAREFLSDAIACAHNWGESPKHETIRRRLVCTIPGNRDFSARSALDELIAVCRTRGNSPQKVKVASPFYDVNGDTDTATRELCKKMAYGRTRHVTFAIPTDRAEYKAGEIPRLCAPAALIKTARSYAGQVGVEVLPFLEDNNVRPWHAKMIALTNESYAALMTGSSNFTCAGLGLTTKRNAEANLLTIANRIEYGREAGVIAAIWPKTQSVPDPDAAEWAGPNARLIEEEQASNLAPPAGFLLATFEAGDKARLIVHLDAEHLPQDWSMHSVQGQLVSQLLTSDNWREGGRLSVVKMNWGVPSPPEKLIVRWLGFEAFLPLNIEDSGMLPPPTQLERMTADDMLGILAAADPSAAIRSWSRSKSESADFDEELDSASPIELDPLRRYELGSTFLHRIRRRARVLTQMRENLERPAWGRQAVEWRLHGLIGIEALASRFFSELEYANGTSNEALLTLADFFIVLREVNYQSAVGALSKAEFDTIFKEFLVQLAAQYKGLVRASAEIVSVEALDFWERVVLLCQS
jgi:hypothetical protein